MKVRSKVIVGVSSVLIIVLAFMMVNQKDSLVEENAISNGQSDSKQKKADEEAGSAENDRSSDSVSVSSDNEPMGEDANQDQTEEDTSQAQMGVEANKDETSETSEAGVGEIAPSTGNHSAGLHFSSREEAMAFGFSRLTEEEIDLYNRAAQNGLTPEIEAMTIQLAYSRFSPEEVAALEEALR
jgi:hypothetical protein